jgi:hypothetical protein
LPERVTDYPAWDDLPEEMQEKLAAAGLDGVLLC